MLEVHKLEYSSNTNMPSALSASDAQELRRLIPLNTLSDSRFEQLCSQIRIDEAPKGSILFRQGETKNEFVYLLSGTISLQAGGVEMDSISGGTDTARFALAHQIPRKVSAVANDTVRYVRIKPEIINQQEELNRDVPTYKVSDIPEEPTRDWMTALLKSPLFQRLSPANIQAILRSLEEIEVKAGDVICRQGDPGDFYYIIKKGRCALTRKPSRLAKEIKLATLKISDTFGEDSLISGDPRNVTVTMVTDGILLRLDKASFIKLLKEPVISHVDFETAQRMASRDAVWLDVRAPDVYEQGRLPGSLNIPFFSLRVMLPTLNRQGKYLLVCEDGRLSEASAFLLIRYGFEAHVLAGGIGNVPRDHLVVEATKWSPSRSSTAPTYSASQPGQSDLTTFEMDTDIAQDSTRQEGLLSGLYETADYEGGRTEDSEETRTTLDTAPLAEPASRESESLGPISSMDHAPTLDALLSSERKKSRDSEDQSAALQRRLRELEATIQESLLRERDLAERLAASENTAAEAVSRTHALEKQLTKAGDIVSSVASVTEKYQQAEERLLKAKGEIDSLKAKLEKARELASDREAALLSLRENYELLLAEHAKNAGARNNPELDTVRRQHGDELMALQARLRDMEEEGNQLREALQSARTRLAVMESAASAAQAGNEDQKKKLHFEFAVTFPVTLVITLLLTALVFGGLFGTASGRKFLSRLLTQTSQASPERIPPNPMSSAPMQGS
jgi:CRP-like cAMP-binding protein